MDDLEAICRWVPMSQHFICRFTLELLSNINSNYYLIAAYKYKNFITNNSLLCSIFFPKIKRRNHFHCFSNSDFIILNEPLIRLAFNPSLADSVDLWFIPMATRSYIEYVIRKSALYFVYFPTITAIYRLFEEEVGWSLPINKVKNVGRSFRNPPFGNREPLEYIKLEMHVIYITCLKWIILVVHKPNKWPE
jgi:hypothetical protein